MEYELKKPRELNIGDSLIAENGLFLVPIIIGTYNHILNFKEIKKYNIFKKL